MATKPKPKSVRPKVRREQPGAKPMPNPRRGPLEESTQGVIPLIKERGQSSGDGATGSWPDSEGMQKYLNAIKERKGTDT
jgi:hypothetical protein